MRLFNLFLVTFLSLSSFVFSEQDVFSVENSKQKKIEVKKKQSQKTIAYNLHERIINPNSPLCQYAAKNDIIALKKNLLSSKNIRANVNTICKNNESLFLISVKNDNYAVAKFLIENGANINIRNEAGVTALHIVAHKEIDNAEKFFNLLMRSKNLDLNAKDIEGYTPLMRAIEFEKVSIVSALVKRKADLNVKNNYGKDAKELANILLDGKKTDEERKNINAIINILNKNE